MSDENSYRRAHLSQWMKSNWKVLSGITAVSLGVLVPVIISLGLPGDELMDHAPSDTFESALQISAHRSMGSFMWWYKTNVVLQITLLLASLAAAVTAALTTQQNAQTLKIWSVFFTAMTAAVATAQQTFHVKENINTFIASTWKLELLAYDYASQRAQLIGLTSDNGPDKKTPAPSDLLNIQKDIMQKYADIEADRMRAWASIGEQGNHISSANAPSPPAAPNASTPPPAR